MGKLVYLIVNALIWFLIWGTVTKAGGYAVALYIVMGLFTLSSFCCCAIDDVRQICQRNGASVPIWINVVLGIAAAAVLFSNGFFILGMLFAVNTAFEFLAFSKL